MKFTKMQGAGNDYIYLNCMERFPDNPNELAVKLSDRHFGIGADGLICICPSLCADFKMRIFNADGTEGEMCGNGLRCAAKYVYDKGLTGKKKLVFETKAGLRTVELSLNNGRIEYATANMGTPITGDKVNISVKGKIYTGTVISVGNPHFVIMVPDLESLDVSEIGPEIEKNPMFEQGVNIEFVKLICKGEIQVRVWERGSGETMACGTGACAAAAVVADSTEAGSNMAVRFRGGTLEICFKDRRKQVLLTGPVETVFEGEVFDEDQ